MVFLSFPFRPGTGKEKNSTKRNSKRRRLRPARQQHHLSAEPLPGAEHLKTTKSSFLTGEGGSYVLKSLIIAQDER